MKLGICIPCGKEVTQQKKVSLFGHRYYHGKCLVCNKEKGVLGKTIFEPFTDEAKKKYPQLTNVS